MLAYQTREPTSSDSPLVGLELLAVGYSCLSMYVRARHKSWAALYAVVRKTTVEILRRGLSVDAHISQWQTGRRMMQCSSVSSTLCGLDVVLPIWRQRDAGERQLGTMGLHFVRWSCGQRVHRLQ
jgi:hypothetical protein